MSFGPVLQHSLNPSVTLLNWVKVYNAVCTPTPIHRLCTQTFSPPQKTNVLLGIEPAAPPPSQSPSRDVNPLHQSTTPGFLHSANFHGRFITFVAFLPIHLHAELGCTLLSGIISSTICSNKFPLKGLTWYLYVLPKDDLISTHLSLLYEPVTYTRFGAHDALASRSNK